MPIKLMQEGLKMDILSDLTNQYQKPVLLVISIIIILFVYIILSKWLTRFAKKNENVFLDDLSTGIKLISRFFAGYLIIITIMVYYTLDQNIILLLTGLVTAIISLSSIQIINNFLSGIVLIILQPFEVNDYVNINGFEGRITRITLNYTKLVTINDAYVLLPNRIILHADLVNYTLHKKQQKKDQNSYFNEAQELLSPFLGDKVTKYNFTLSLDIASLPTVIPNLKQICSNYKKTFGYEPALFLFDLGWKVTYQFQIRCDDSEIIRTNLKGFRNELLKVAYP